jgi:hypothetical protein
MPPSWLVSRDGKQPSCHPEFQVNGLQTTTTGASIQSSFLLLIFLKNCPSAVTTQLGRRG